MFRSAVGAQPVRGKGWSHPMQSLHPLISSTSFRAHQADTGHTKGGIMSALRPLPPRLSLEFERKEAKALLRRLRAGDPEALARARARHPAIDASESSQIRLADAQLVIAREYGFASWPRLVRYFGDVDRQRHGLHRYLAQPDRDYAGWVRAL